MDSSQRSPNFHTTHWSIVAAAGDSGNPDQAAALSLLCERYWQPLYAFIRRSGHSAQDAEDMTQSFFSQLLEKDFLSQADQHRGRFRTFMLAAFKHFVANQKAHANAKKRGGDATHVPLNFAEAEQKYQQFKAEHWTAEALFEREWALALLTDVLNELQSEYERAGKTQLFHCLKPTLTGGELDQSYAEIARQLESTTGAIKVAVHRLRKAYRNRLNDHLSATLVGDEDLESEREFLLRALAGPGVQ